MGPGASAETDSSFSDHGFMEACYTSLTPGGQRLDATVPRFLLETGTTVIE